MEELSFIKAYKDDEQLRKSFNELARMIFGIEFETWYQHGFWTEKYQPYSFIAHGKVVANVSVNLLNLVFDGEVKPSVQIGTVMTHPDFRKKGLSRKLMDIVLRDFNNIELIYLFANQTVLDFYPKFGFKAAEEVQFSMDYSYIPSSQSGVKKLDGEKAEDLAFIYSLAANRKAVSKIFGTTSSAELLMFYCIMVFSQDLYYLEDEQALVIFQQEGGQLHLYDVVTAKEVNVLTILSKITTPNVNQVVFHYHPDDHNLILTGIPCQSSTVLFIKNLSNVSIPKRIKHPLTSQA